MVIRTPNPETNGINIRWLGVSITVNKANKERRLKWMIRKSF